MENRKMGRRITATLMAAILVASSSVAVFGQDGEVVLDPAESMLMDEQMQAAPESEDIILTAEQLAAIPPSTADFEIDAKGVLTKYKGSGGDVIIPDGVTGIGFEAFSNCTGLTSVSIPNSVTSIGLYAFNGCRRLISVNIPNKVTTIEMHAFRGCSVLTNVTIPNSVSYIGHFAFCGCDSLTSITIPSSVQGIGNLAFTDCKGLTNIDVDDSNRVFSSVDGVLLDKQKTQLIACPAGKKGYYIIPDSVTSISNNAFSSCSGLTGVSMPNGMNNMGEFAFAQCTGLTSVTIPNGVNRIRNRSFAGCTNLTTVTIPSTVTVIEDFVFWGCNLLTIRGKKSSYAETYAKSNKIPFKIIEAQKPADLDGDGEVNLTDLMSVLHGVSKRTEFTQEQITIADVTHDGKVDIEDLMKILHFVSGRIPSLD